MILRLEAADNTYRPSTHVYGYCLAFLEVSVVTGGIAVDVEARDLRWTSYHRQINVVIGPDIS